MSSDPCSDPSFLGSQCGRECCIVYACTFYLGQRVVVQFQEQADYAGLSPVVRAAARNSSRIGLALNSPGSSGESNSGCHCTPNR